MSVSYLENEQDQKIAYIHTPAQKHGIHLPSVIFLGGFKSDMQGTKALFLEEECKKRGQEFIRFDYTGHGISDGAFEDGTISSWKDNARDILDQIITNDVILVGSSMGGWIALLLLLERSERIKGVIGIAAAPDFTREIKERLTPEQYQTVMDEGRIEIPNDYSDDPYIFTRALIEGGERQCLLDTTHIINIPLTLIQGKKDADVPWEKAEKIKSCFKGTQTEIIFIEDGDHRLSKPDELEVISMALKEML